MRGSTCPWTECRSVTISMVSRRIVVKQENGLLCLSISLDRHDSVVRICFSDIMSGFGAIVANCIRLMPWTEGPSSTDSTVLPYCCVTLERAYLKSADVQRHPDITFIRMIRASLAQCSGVRRLHVEYQWVR